MLVYLTRFSTDQFPLANLFRYITFRSGAACLTALVLSLRFGPADGIRPGVWPRPPEGGRAGWGRGADQA